jgi:hypothetical protein
MDSARLLASTGTGSALEGGVDDWWTGDFVRTLGMGGVSYCGVNPGRDQRCSMEAPPNFQLDSGQTPEVRWRSVSGDNTDHLTGGGVHGDL